MSLPIQLQIGPIHHLARSSFFISLISVASFAIAEGAAHSENLEQPTLQEEVLQEVAPKLPEAEKIDLDKPILPEQPLPKDVVQEPVSEASAQQPETVAEPVAEAAEISAPAGVTEPTRSLILLGKEVKPGITTRLSWVTEQSFEGIASPAPVLVAHGSKPGPVLCITGAIHGDELNGIEIVRRVLYDLNPEILSGTVIGVPIVNLQGFHRSSRYLTDRRDLTRKAKISGACPRAG